MLDNLSNKLNKVIKYLKGEAKLTEDNVKNALREIKLSLLEADVNYKVVKEFTESIKKRFLGKEVQESLTPYQYIVKIVKEEIENILGNEAKDLKKANYKPAIIMLVGLQGTGKTTTAGKLALHLKNLGKSVLLCSLDLKRLAAGEQLKVISKEIDVNFFETEQKKLKKIVNELMSVSKKYGYDYIIVDTAGRLHIDEELMEELKQVKSLLKPLETIYVADSLTGQDAVNSGLKFSESIGIDSVILTKLDADSRGGAALSIVKVTNKPIKFIGIGEKYSDFQKFYPDRLASKILGMGDVLSLIEKAEKEFDEKEAEKIAKRMLKNEFSLEDYRFQLLQIKKLGSMQDIMAMLPNMGMGKNMANINMDDKKVDHMIAIINSMTKKEREKPKIINGRRRLRISRGSGRPVQEVNQLIKSYFEAKKVMKKPFFRKMMKKFDIFSKMR